ncbi:MAG: RNase adapter RapZ [Gammaproteobacteria bacterium]|nr:RNase adapter RapZ [Gammaproteobacteria bacterium]
MKLLIISGTSGAGKSVVLHALEDIGGYCIDNLPMALLPAFAKEMIDAPHRHYEMIAVGLDARNLNNDFATFPTILQQLKKSGLTCEVIFIDATDDILIKRFSETRRRHPLTDNEVPLEEAILQERMLLKPIAGEADIQLDSSRTNIHQLRELIQKTVGERHDTEMSVLFQSFGFKHGIPLEADFIFDVRCLPNPHWEPRLRPLSGRDPEVAHFLENHFEVNRMLEHISGFLEQWLPQFAADNRSYLTVAIGCTGGQHRSVFLVERLSQLFRKKGIAILTRHRELS